MLGYMDVLGDNESLTRQRTRGGGEQGNIQTWSSWEDKNTFKMPAVAYLSVSLKMTLVAI